MLKKTVLIQKKKEIRNKNHRSGFLWLKERRLMHWLIEQQNKAFIQDNSEKEKFKEEFFPTIAVLMVVHVS